VDNSGRVNVTVERHGNVCRARASGKLAWYMEGPPGTYLEHSNKPLKGTWVPAHPGLGGVSGMERTIASNLPSPNSLVPATSDHPGTTVSTATLKEPQWSERPSLVMLESDLNPASPKQTRTCFFFSIYFHRMSRPGHMLPPKPVHYESSHKTFAYFLTCLVAASEVSSILEFCISGSL